MAENPTIQVLSSALVLVCLLPCIGCDEQATSLDDDFDTSHRDVAVGDDGSIAKDTGDTNGDSRDEDTRVLDFDLAELNDATDSATSDGCSEVPLRRLDWQPELHMDRLPRPELSRVYSSPDSFVTALGSPPPAVDFSESWLLLITGRRWTAQDFEVSAAALCATDADAEYRLEVEVRGGTDCDALSATADWRSWALYSIPAVAEDIEVDLGGGLLSTHTGFSCSDEGGALSETCTRMTWCQPGLICAGVSHSAQGVCVDAQAEVASTNTDATAIPDDDQDGVTSPNVISGPNGLVTDVIVQAEIDHPNPAELEVRLVSPAGESATVWDGEHSRQPVRIDRAVEFPSTMAAGTWSLHIADREPGNIGELDRWTLSLVVDP